MPRLDTVGKLNKMYELFTRADDGKLTSGEVEALAGYFKGLPDTGKAKAKERLVAIYQSSDYTPGMKERFKKALLSAGLSARELSATGPGPNSVDKDKVLDTLNRLSDDGAGEGATKTISFAKLPWDVQPSITDALEALKAKTLRKDRDATFGDPIIKAISEPAKNGRAGALVGFTVELPIYADEHDVDRRLSFSKSGVQVGDEYVGE